MERSAEATTGMQFWEKLALKGLIAAGRQSAGPAVDYFRTAAAVGVPADEADPVLVSLMAQRFVTLEADGETVRVTLAGLAAVASARATIMERAG